MAGPRITAELKRRGWEVNHKRVGRILREDNLLCIRKRKFKTTTDSHHGYRVHPNLVRHLRDNVDVIARSQPLRCHAVSNGYSPGTEVAG